MLQIRLFGKIEFTSDGTPADESITLPRPSRALAAHLVLHREIACKRNAVAETLWPDEPLTVGLANVRRHVHILLRALEGAGISDAIAVDRMTLSWRRHPAIRVDIDEFLDSVKTPARIIDTIRVYRDDLATEIEDAWIAPDRSAFHEMFVEACIAGAKHYFYDQEPRLALQVLTTCHAFEPYREDVARALLLIRARNGDVARAVQFGEEFARTLERELAIAPSPLFRDALSNVRRGSFADPFSPEPAVERPSGAVELPRRLGSYSFRGREALFSKLVEQFGSAERAGCAMLLLGETGIGKTRLTRELSAVLEQRQIAVHLVACDARTQRLAFSSIKDILDQLDLAHLARSGKRNVVAIQRAISARRHVDGELSSTAVAEIALKLRDLLVIAADGKPIVVCLDDAEFADSVSLEVIALMRVLPGSAISVLAVSTNETRPHGRAWPAALFASAATTERLAPLGAEDIMKVVQDILQDDALQRRFALSITTAAMGNPLYAQELARYCLLRQTEPNIAKELPASVSSSIHRRIGELPPADVRIMAVCAAIGTTFDFELVSRVADVTMNDVRTAARRARALELVEVDDAADHASFRHRLFQDAILAGIPQTEQRELHARIATALTDTPEAQEAIAYHWERAGAFEQAGERYYTAGEHARSRLAIDDALALYDQAAELAEPASRIQRLIRLGRAYAFYSRGAMLESRRLTETLLHEMESDASVDAVFQSKVLYHLSNCDWALLQRRNAVMWSQRALEVLAGRDDAPVERAAAQTMLAGAAVLRGDVHEALEHLSTVHTGEPSDVSIKARSYRSLAYGMLGDKDAAVRCFTPELTDFQEAALSIPTLAIYRQNQGIVLGWLGHLPPARKAFEGVIEAAARAANPFIEATGYIGLGHLEFYTGNVQLTRFYYDAAAKRLPPRQSLHVAQLYCDALGLKLAATMNDAGAAAALITEEHFTLCEGLEDILLFNTLTGALIEYCIAFGDTSRAKMLLTAYLTKLRVGAGLYYVLLSLLQIGDRADLTRAAELARAWAHGGENEMGESIRRLISAAMELQRGRASAARASAISAIPGFERAGLQLFVRAAEQFANGESTSVAL